MAGRGWAESPEAFREAVAALRLPVGDEELPVLRQIVADLLDQAEGLRGAARLRGAEGLLGAAGAPGDTEAPPGDDPLEGPGKPGGGDR